MENDYIEFSQVKKLQVPLGLPHLVVDQLPEHGHGPAGEGQEEAAGHVGGHVHAVDKVARPALGLQRRGGQRRGVVLSFQ